MYKEIRYVNGQVSLAMKSRSHIEVRAVNHQHKHLQGRMQGGCWVRTNPLQDVWCIKFITYNRFVYSSPSPYLGPEEAFLKLPRSFSAIPVSKYAFSWHLPYCYDVTGKKKFLSHFYART